MVCPTFFPVVSTAQWNATRSLKKNTQLQSDDAVLLLNICCNHVVLCVNMGTLVKHPRKTATEWPCSAFHLSTNNTILGVFFFFLESHLVMLDLLSFSQWIHRFGSHLTVTDRDHARLTGKARPWLWWVGFFTFQASLAALVIGFFLYYRNLIYYWNYSVPRRFGEFAWVDPGPWRRHEMGLEYKHEYTTIHIYIYTHTYIHPCIHTSMHTYIHACMHAYK